VTNLSKGITFLFLIHHFPFEIMEGLESFADLDNNIECIVRKIIYDVLTHTVTFFLTVGVNSIGSLSKVAVLVVLKHKIADGVPRLFSVYELNRPEVTSSSGDEFVESMNFFCNPTSKTLRRGLGNNLSRAGVRE
jgi:hypothetical protein